MYTTSPRGVGLGQSLQHRSVIRWRLWPSFFALQRGRSLGRGCGTMTGSLLLDWYAATKLLLVLSQLMRCATRPLWECSSPSYSSVRTMLRIYRPFIVTSISDLPSDSTLRGEPISESTLLSNAKTVYVAELFYYVIQLSLKLSILAFYWRIFKVSMRVPIYLVTCFVTMWFIATVSLRLPSLT